jgi:uncharacterized membrane protein YphA (DoxX/SURF4 family)
MNMLNRLAKLQPWITLLFRLALGAVLLIAGGLKIGNPQKSAMAVRAFEVLPIDIANFFGYFLPWFEIGVGALLILGVAVKISAFLSGGIMFVFILAISQAWARGLSIDCGCFGGGGVIDPSETKYLEDILRDLGLMLMAIYLYRFPSGRFALDKE